MKKVRLMCLGCRDDFYNQDGQRGCWYFATAKVVSKTAVGIWQNPPYEWEPRPTLSCHSPDGAVWIDKNDPRIETAE